MRTPNKTSSHTHQNQYAATPLIDFQSARKVMPEENNLSLRIFSGEVIHPEVDKFIKSTITDTCNNEVCISSLIFLFYFSCHPCVYLICIMHF